MKRTIVSLIGAIVMSMPAYSATYNNEQPPAFLWVDICTNGIGDADELAIVTPRLEPEVFDIGIDFGADGSVDRWLSQETMAYLGRGNAESVNPGNWRRFIIRLEDQVGTEARIRIVDKSDEYYLAVNAVRLNYSDGTVVENAVQNGWFEDGLTNWTVVESSLPEDQLIVENDGELSVFGNQFFATGISSEENANTAVIESDPFTINAVSSFVYGTVSGGASAMWSNEDSAGFDESGVFLDIADSEAELNGEYDEGTDIPVRGFYGGVLGNVRNQQHPVVLNTSGLEGKFCQIVAIDDSDIYHIGLDSWRMNWDINIIRNGGFDEGIPRPFNADASMSFWWSEADPIEYLEHPEATAPSGDQPGTIPGWKFFAPSDGLDSAWFWDKECHGNQFSGHTYLGTAGFSGGRVAVGIKVVSDPFMITAIPNPADSVFVQFNAAQGSSRDRWTADGTTNERGTVQLQIDMDGNGEFDDEGDVTHEQLHANMGHNLNNSNMDVWHYPDYRFYIPEDQQGKEARIFVQDTLGPERGSYGWMCVDDFFLWDSQSADLPFPNSDFEQGTLENWEPTYDINGGDLGTLGETGWLSGSVQPYLDGLVDHMAMNNRHTDIDGQFAADTAAFQAGINGDRGTGTLISVPFTLPMASGTAVKNWSLFETTR